MFAWVFIFCCALVSIAATSADVLALKGHFASWKKEHGKAYATEAETAQRFVTFSANWERIGAWNRQPNVSYTMGMNRFGDLTAEEFRAMYAAASTPPRKQKQNRTAANVTSEDLPSFIDWNKKGAVTEVKDQGPCGACWAFSSTGAMEGTWQIATGDLVSMSEQYLMDCEDTNLGCRGGLPPNAFEWVISEAHGVESETGYPTPYNPSTKGKKCQMDKTKFVANFSDYTELDEGDEEGLHIAVGKGVVSIGMDAGGDGNFQFYKSGVFTSKRCSKQIDHAVLATGYGTTDEGVDYWIVKNSYGGDWGKKGFFWIARGENMCGVAEYCAYITK